MNSLWWRDVALVLGWLAGVSLGVGIGLSWGLRLGRRRANPAVALALRQRALRDGRCPVCAGGPQAGAAPPSPGHHPPAEAGDP